MSDNSFQIYLDSVVTLAQTLIVKDEYVAQRINERLLQVNEFTTDPEDQSTWKYYMNLAGEYHSTDTVMRVISSDNLEEIDFTPANMLLHPNTYRDYQYGTRQYGELLNKYPSQEDVILGVLYPIDKAAAIAAKDHKILGYPTNLIQSNEYTLVESLQEWTDIYFKRYYNEQYSISDSMAYSVSLSMYRINLIMSILVERLTRHKTIEAHSFYVQQYLASNSNLGIHHPFMTLKQAMHFYRNIRYYQRHAGMNETLEDLIDALMTKRYMPMASYTMRHDTTTQVEDIYPAVTFKRKDMTVIPSSGAPEYVNTTTFLAKEAPDAPANDEEIAYSASVIEQKLMDSPSNVVQTKVLESAMVNYADAVTYKLEDVQVAHWLYHAYTGRYSAVVNVSNPKTSERIVLSVKDAYILATYCMFKMYDFEPPVQIPLLGAERVQRSPAPTDDDIKSILDMTYITDFSWSVFRSKMPAIPDMISIDSFYATTHAIFESANFQRDLISFQEGMHERGEVFKMVDRLYADYYVWLEPEGTTYAQWLSSLSLNFDTLDQNEFGDLYASIVAAAIGKNLSTAPSLRNIQKAMAAALKDLSSYTIQVVTKMADDSTIMTDFPSIRAGNQNVSAGAHEYIRLGYVDVLSQEVSGTMTKTVGIDIMKDLMSRTLSAKTHHYLDLQNGPHIPYYGIVHKHKFPISRVNWAVVDKPDTSGTKLQPVLGMKYYMALTDEQKASLFEQ